MKACAFFVLLICCASVAFAANLPTEIKLTNGAVLRKVSVVRWGKDTVVLKHVGGVDPVRYENIAPPHRAAFEKARGQGLQAETEKKQEAARRVQDAKEAERSASEAADQERAKQKDIETAMARLEIVIGMTKDQVRRTWGEPPETLGAAQSRSGTSESWRYRGRGLDDKGRAVDVRVYFDDGVVTYISKG